MAEEEVGAVVLLVEGVGAWHHQGEEAEEVVEEGQDQPLEGGQRELILTPLL